MHICCFNSVSHLRGKSRNYENIKRVVLQVGRFSVFDIETNKDGKLFTRLCNDPELEIYNLDYPWIGVRLPTPACSGRLKSAAANANRYAASCKDWSLMKTLTLTQPWATLVAIGAKKIETRSWNTAYRGKLAIHAAKGFPADAQHLCFRVPFRDYLADYVALNETYLGKHKFPLGAVVATCDLVKVVRIYANSYIPGKPELMFGDYSVGRYMWYLENVEVFPEPIPAKGSLGLWDWGGITQRAGGRVEKPRQNELF